MQNTQEQTEQSRPEAGPEGAQSAGVWAELQRAQALASQVSSWGGEMAGLAWLEFQLAMQSLPRILGLLVALIPIAGLTWITLSLLLAWFAYAASGIVAVGLGALFGLQLMVLLLCVWRIKTLKERSSFRETRQQWQLFLQELTREQETHSGEDHSANRH